MLEHKANKLFANAAIMSAIVGLCIFAQPAFATEIGNTGNFIPGNNGVYDITPETFDGNVGFRQYEKFNLDNGDVANLIFKQGGSYIETFVNMVDNTININGIVNTMRDGAFYNGKAVFISPNGMVVGPTGVLNVGSLQILTPTNDAYSTLKSATNISNYLNAAENIGSGVITINGKVFTSKSLGYASMVDSASQTVGQNSPGVDIQAGSVNIAEGAGIMAGVGEGMRNGSSITRTAMHQLSDADVLFTTLVNLNHNTLTGTNTWTVYDDGKIVINAKDENGTGLNVAGHVKNFGRDPVLLQSQAGFTIASAGNVSSQGRISYYNNANGNLDANMILQGKTRGTSVQIANDNSDIIVGDSNIDEQVVAYNGTVFVDNYSGDILPTGDKGPNGEAKTHFVSSANMRIVSHDGAIGYGNVSGVGPDARDVGSSINIRTGFTGAEVRAKNDINLASINHDFRGSVRSEYGRVILLADSAVKGETPYSILTSYGFLPEIEGKGISLVASGSIGSASNQIRINAKDSANYGVDILAKTGDIYVKAINDNVNVGTVIAKEGNVDLHFTGNADINEITAAKNVNIAAEGKTLKIENMGSVPNTPTDYYGANSEIAAKNIELTALDIANGKTTNAHSEVVVTNTRVKPDADSDTPDITVAADNVYIDGKHFVRDDSNKVVVEGNGYVRFADLNDDRTNPVQNANDNIASLGVKAVRPDDVVVLGGLEDVRNYYYEDELPEVVDNSSKDDEGKRTYQRKSDDDDVAIIDKRKYMRFSIADNKNVVELESNPVIDSLIDISRGGVAIKHHKSLKVGDIVPIQLSFGGLDIDTNVKIVTATDVRAGAEFVDLDHATANKLLYMNILLQEAYGGNGLIKIK